MSRICFPESRLLVLMHLVKFRKIISEPRSRVRRKIDVTTALFLLLTYQKNRASPEHIVQLSAERDSEEACGGPCLKQKNP